MVQLGNSLLLFLFLFISYGEALNITNNNHINNVKSRNIYNNELDTVLRRVGERCPYMSMKGIQKACSGLMKGSATTTNNEDFFKDLLVGGLGYDRFNHEMKGQVLKSKIYTQNKEERSTTLYNSYFRGDMKVTVAQKQYLSFSAQVTGVTTEDLTEEFKQILEFLPDTYNAEIYQKVIDYFGDLVTTNVVYGGVIDQMSSIKVCYNDPQMLKYVEQQLEASIIIDGSVKPPNGFVNYVRADQIGIVGGNPQEGDINNRIRSFSNNPAPILFNAVPIWTVFPEGAKKDNMKRAYDDFVNNFSQKMGAEANYLQSLIAQEQFNPFQAQEVQLFATQTPVCGISTFWPGQQCVDYNHGCRKACIQSLGTFRLNNGETATVGTLEFGGKVRDNTGKELWFLAQTGRNQLKVGRDGDRAITLWTELYTALKNNPWRFSGNMDYVKPGYKTGCVGMEASKYWVNDPRANGVTIQACVRCVLTINPDGSSGGCDCPKLR
ncbi:hypothetical protein ABK040_013491 [Willaertia magna]